MKKKHDRDQEPSFAGVVSKDVYDQYKNSSARKKKINKIALTVGIVVVLAVSVVTIVVVFNKLYFSPDTDSTESAYNCSSGKEPSSSSIFQIEGETVTEEMSLLYNIPVGFKIKRIDKNSRYVGLLMVNDIIIKVGNRTRKKKFRAFTNIRYTETAGPKRSVRAKSDQPYEKTGTDNTVRSAPDSRGHHRGHFVGQK